MDISTDTIIFYRSFYEAISKFKDSEQLELYKAVFSLAFDNIDTNFSNAMQEAIFTVMRPNIMANIKNQTNGKKGGRPSNKPQQPPKENECSQEDIEDFIADYREIKNSDFEPTEREKMLITTTLSDIGEYKADYWRKVFKKSKAGFLIDGQKIPVSLRKILLEHNAIFRGEANLAPDEEEKQEKKERAKQVKQQQQQEMLEAVEAEKLEREQEKSEVDSAETAIEYLNKYLGNMPFITKQISSDYKEFKAKFDICLSQEGEFFAKP